MKLRGLITALILTLFGSQELFASHIAGAEITYRHLFSSTYSFQLKVYRDCNECKFNGIGGGENSANCNDVPALIIRGALGTGYSSSQLGIVETARKSISDLTPVCNGSVSKCRTGSNLNYGYEEHVFEGVYDFSSLLGNGYCKFDVSISMSSRNLSINTMMTEQTFFNFAMLNLCEGINNHSSVFAAAPVFFYNQNKSNFISPGVKNPDGDSLAFHLRPALVNRNQTIAYASGRNYDYPYTSYCSSGAPSCSPNPASSPAEGFYCSRVSGDIVFTPLSSGQGGIVVLECEEWKKNATGAWYLAGISRRDVYGDVLAQVNNNPVFKGLNSDITLCENQSYSAELLIEDTPSPGIPADTVFATLISEMKGLVLDRVSINTAPYYKYILRLEPGLNAPGTYYAGIQLRDNHCPLNGTAIRTIRLTNQKIRQLNISSSVKNCGALEAVAANFSNRNVNWTLKDADGRILIQQNARKLNHQLLQGGKYWIEVFHPAENGFCEVRQKDSIQVPDFKKPELSMGANMRICTGSSLDLMPLLFKTYGDYNLSVNNQAIAGFPYAYKPVQNGVLNFKVQQTDGCAAEASIAIDLHPVLQYQKKNDTVCVNDIFPKPVNNIGFDAAKVDNINYSYQSSGSVLEKTDRHHWLLRLSGPAAPHTMTLYSVMHDNNGCAYRDTTYIQLLQAEPVAVKCPEKICVNAAPITLETGAGGQWECVNYPAMVKGGILSPSSVSFTTLILKYSQKLRCFNSATFYVQPLDTAPLFIAHPADLRLCENSGLTNLKASPSGGLWTGNYIENAVFNPAAGAGKTSRATYTFTNANACVSRSGIRIHVEKLPVLKVQSSASKICVGDVIQLQALSSFEGPGYWFTDGSGTFEKPASTLTNYRPGNADVAKGRIRFTYTIQTGDVCGNVSDFAEAEITKGPQGDIIRNYPSGICEPAALEFSTTYTSLEKQYWFINDSLVEEFDYGFKCNAVLKAGEYVIKTRVRDSACEAMSISGTITVYPKPNPEMQSNPVQKVSREYPRIYLKDKSTSKNGHRSNWYFNRQWIGSESEFFYRADDSRDSFTITLKVSSNLGSCTDSVSRLFVFIPIHQLYIPDAFSPDAKGPQENNFFRAYGPDMRYFHIEVFNRFGEKVFVSDNMNEGWDGRYMQTECMQGVYFYKISSTDMEGISRDYSGTVTLIR